MQQRWEMKSSIDLEHTYLHVVQSCCSVVISWIFMIHSVQSTWEHDRRLISHFRKPSYSIQIIHCTASSATDFWFAVAIVTALLLCVSHSRSHCDTNLQKSTKCLLSDLLAVNADWIDVYQRSDPPYYERQLQVEAQLRITSCLLPQYLVRPSPYEIAKGKK